MDAAPSLTGNQLWYIRRALGETQGQFAKRLFLYQVRIYRMEAIADGQLKARDAHDILRIAEKNGINIPSAEDAKAARIGAAEKSEPAETAA